MSFITVIMAAGKGSRMHSSLPKPLHTIEKKPLIHYVIEAARGVGKTRLVIVVSPSSDEVRATCDTYSPLYGVQECLNGTGGAVRAVQTILSKAPEEDVLVLSADNPLITPETLSGTLEHHRANGGAATILSAHIPNPYAYGRIIRDSSGAVIRIVEEKDANDEERAVGEVNSGTYLFRKEYLLPALEELSSHNAQNEYYITDIIGIFHDKGLLVTAYTAPDHTDILGVNTQEQLSEATEIIRKRDEA